SLQSFARSYSGIFVLIPGYFHDMTSCPILRHGLDQAVCYPYASLLAHRLRKRLRGKTSEGSSRACV
ncbi:MAG TPA: hypothetical protein VN151_05080, partial [Terracidiphilus sp.]|nr:hypothetical protein [Terracidiphilus sp.]